MTALAVAMALLAAQPAEPPAALAPLIEGGVLIGTVGKRYVLPLLGLVEHTQSTCPAAAGVTTTPVASLTASAPCSGSAVFTLEGGRRVTVRTLFLASPPDPQAPLQQLELELPRGKPVSLYVDGVEHRGLGCSGAHRFGGFANGVLTLIADGPCIGPDVFFMAGGQKVLLRADSTGGVKSKSLRDEWPRLPGPWVDVRVPYENGGRPQLIAQNGGTEWLEVELSAGRDSEGSSRIRRLPEVEVAAGEAMPIEPGCQLVDAEVSDWRVARVGALRPQTVLIWGGNLGESEFEGTCATGQRVVTHVKVIATEPKRRAAWEKTLTTYLAAPPGKMGPNGGTVTLYQNEQWVFSAPCQLQRLAVDASLPGLQRIAIGDASIADVKTIGNNQVLVIGAQVGKTTILAWCSNGKRFSFLVEVLAGTRPLKASPPLVVKSTEAPVTVVGPDGARPGKVTVVDLPGELRDLQEVTQADGGVYYQALDERGLTVRIDLTPVATARRGPAARPDGGSPRDGGSQ